MQERYIAILEFSFKWVKVVLPYRGGGGVVPVVGDGGSLITRSAGSMSFESWQVCHTL